MLKGFLGRGAACPGGCSTLNTQQGTREVSARSQSLWVPYLECEWKIAKTQRPDGFLGYPLKSSKSPSAQISCTHSPWLQYQCCVTPSMTQHCCVSAVGLAQTFCHHCTKPRPLFPPCRWSHVGLHEDEAEILVRILLPLPELRTFGYVSSCDLFLIIIFIICSVLCLRPVLLVLHTRGVEMSPNLLVSNVCAVWDLGWDSLPVE